MIMVTYANNRIILYLYVHNFFFCKLNLTDKCQRSSFVRNHPRTSAYYNKRVPTNVLYTYIYNIIYYAYNIINAYIRCEDLCFSSGRFETIRFCALNAFMLQGAK